MSFNVISVVGLGYIGLPTAAVIASRRKEVIGIDINQHAVDTINRGDIHIVEPELDIIVHAAVKEGYLRATTVPEPADAFLIAVPTPFKAEDGNDHVPDLSYIEAASRMIAPVLKKGDLVILESTSPVGATEQMAAWLAETRPDLTFPQTHEEHSDIRIAHCPERVLPGHVVRELVENDRVIGGMTAKCSKVATSLYKIFVEGECVTTSVRTAEMAKLTENSFRDVNIAFANELSVICDKLNINVWELIRLANRHPRVNILQPGPGVGGHCIAVDPWFIVSETPDEAKLISMARGVNSRKPEWVVKKVEEKIDSFLKNITATEEKIEVTCFGLAFKANIDDLRESPAVEVIKKLSEDTRLNVSAVEPNVKVLPLSLTERNIQLCTLEYALANCDIAVLLVDHKEFTKENLLFRDDCEVVDAKGLMQ